MQNRTKPNRIGERALSLERKHTHSMHMWSKTRKKMNKANNKCEHVKCCNSETWTRVPSLSLCALKCLLNWRERPRAHISVGLQVHAWSMLCAGKYSQHTISLNPHKNLRVLMFYGVLLFQRWQLTTPMITMVAIAIKWRIFTNIETHFVQLPASALRCDLSRS